MAGMVSEALRHVESARSKRNLEFAVQEASLHFHKHARLVDQEAVRDIEKTLPTLEESATNESILLLIPFHLHQGNWSRAKQLAEKMDQNVTTNDAEISTALGWVYAFTPVSEAKCVEKVNQSVNFFQGAISQQQAETK